VQEFTWFSFFNMLAGLSFFLYGMKFAEKGLRKISGRKLRSSIDLLTRNRLFGLVAGIGLTFLTQSSSATSVMLIGLTSAGLMTLVQSVGMLLGSDIGTTLTVQLFTFKFYRLAPLLIAAGFFFFAFSASYFRQRAGQIVMAFGMIFFGMEMISAAAMPLQHNALFVEIFRASTGGVASGILVSAIFTAIFQSSAATIAILLALSGSAFGHGPILTFAQSVPLILGANIGTCATALIAAARADPEARRVAWAHTMFKVLGVLVVLPFLGPFIALCAGTATDVTRQIANAHTIFNVAIALLFLPLVGPFVRFIVWLVPIKESAEGGYRVEFLSPSVLKVPALALGQAAREIVRMSGLVTRMVRQSITVFSEANEPLRRKLVDSDNEVDFLQESLVPFLSQLSQEELTPEQSAKTVQLLSVTAELEQAADVVSKYLMQHAKKRIEKGFLFSDEGWKEIQTFHERVTLNLEQSISAFTLNDETMARGVLEQKPEMDRYLESLRQSHISRIRRGLRETLETTTVHLDLLDDMNLINKHAFRMVATIASGIPNIRSAQQNAPATREPA